MNDARVVLTSLLTFVQDTLPDQTAYSLSATQADADVLVRVARGSEGVTLRAPLVAPTEQGEWDASAWGHLLGSLIVETLDTQRDGRFPDSAAFEAASGGLLQAATP